MRVALLLLLSILAFAPPAMAQLASGMPRSTGLDWTRLYMRNTAATSTARDPNWTTRGSCQTCSPSGFADSSVFRRGATTRTVYDTTRALDLRTVPWAPNFGNVAMNALTDSTYLPWLYMRVLQDTTSVTFSGASSLDSVFVGAEVSLNGIDWFTCQGTPTQRFAINFFTSSPADGAQAPALIGQEASPGEDMAQFVFKCHPFTTVDNIRITNRSLCFWNGYVRFIIGMAASGQFGVDVGTWANP